MKIFSKSEPMIFVILATVILLNGCSVAAHAYEMQRDSAINPEIDLKQLDFATITMFFFDVEAQCGDDVVRNFHTAGIDILKENNIGVNFIDEMSKNDDSKNNDFSLDSAGNKDKYKLFDNAGTDIVMNGTLQKVERYTKKWGKSVIQIKADLFFYSKSKDTVVYRVSYDNMINGNFSYKLLREAMEQMLEPFLNELHKDE